MVVSLHAVVAHVTVDGTGRPVETALYAVFGVEGKGNVGDEVLVLGEGEMVCGGDALVLAGGLVAVDDLG